MKQGGREILPTTLFCFARTKRVIKTLSSLFPAAIPRAFIQNRVLTASFYHSIARGWLRFQPVLPEKYREIWSVECMKKGRKLRFDMKRSLEKKIQLLEKRNAALTSKVKQLKNKDVTD